MENPLRDQIRMENSSREQRMDNKLYSSVAKKDDPTAISAESDDHLLRKTSVNNNILHIALIYNRNSIAKEVQRRFPDLIWDKNMDGNTPFHIAAEMGNKEFVSKVCDEVVVKDDDLSLLRMKNSMGNTALHVAIIHNYLHVAYILVNKDPYLASIVNTKMEAPLHLVIKHHPDDDKFDRKTCPIIKLVTSLSSKNRDKVGDLNDAFENTSRAEQMVTMIVMLLEKENDVACWRDAAGGLTPLLKAATSLNKNHNVIVAILIIAHCPQSVEVRDNSGKNILHHLISYGTMDHRDCRRLFNDRIPFRLINQQDIEGNTPLLMAIINNDVIMVELLKKMGGNLFINNNLGQNAATLIKTEKRQVKREDWDAAEHGDIWALNIRYLYIGGIKYLASSLRDSEGKNLLHKLFLIKWGNVIVDEIYLSFIEDIIHVDRLKQTDSNKDTPLHILARLEPQNIKIHFSADCRDNRHSVEHGIKIGKQLCAESPNYKLYTDEPYVDYAYDWVYLESTPVLSKLINYCAEKLPESSFDGPLSMQNLKGNTALHEAIISKNHQVLVKLAELSRDLSLVNHRNETILHLLANLKPKFVVLAPPIAEEVMNDIIENNSKDKHLWYDVDGLSPLMRAIQADNIEFATKLTSVNPSLAEAIDHNGQTFWHQLINLPPIPFDLPNNNFFTNETVWSQLKTKDKKGKTPLHLAVEHLRFDLAEAFLGLHGTLTSLGTPVFVKDLLTIQNNEGNTPGDLIGELLYVPIKFEDFMGKASTMIGIRSIWGIPSTQIKDYVNTMGVIAALLTTITFTAAFTVPGGLNQEKGNPLLIQDAAFQTFMIFNIVAMCLSMMVLFCLIWIMATGNKTNAVVLLDFSIILLLASFYATLVTFMTGLYATTYFIKPWVAIVGLVMCTLLLLLMHKYLVMKFIIPSGKSVLIYFDKVIHNARKLRNKILSYVKKHHQRRRSPKSDLPTSFVEMHNSNADVASPELPLSMSSDDEIRSSTSSSFCNDDYKPPQ